MGRASTQIVFARIQSICRLIEALEKDVAVKRAKVEVANQNYIASLENVVSKGENHIAAMENLVAKLKDLTPEEPKKGLEEWYRQIEEEKRAFPSA